jgi:hypothetical protein
MLASHPKASLGAIALKAPQNNSSEGFLKHLALGGLKTLLFFKPGST